MLVSTMNPLYDKHAAAVDQIVEVANEEARSGEAMATKIVHFYTEVMAACRLADSHRRMGAVVDYRAARSRSKPRNCSVPLNSCGRSQHDCRVSRKRKERE